MEGNRLILNIQSFATFSDFEGTKKFLEKKRILFFKRAQGFSHDILSDIERTIVDFCLEKTAGLSELPCAWS